jgi:hypothetical protein
MKNALSKTPDAKLTYLYSFESLFLKKCEAAGINAGRWTQGMWTNAHAGYGLGLTAEDSVSRWFVYVSSVEKSAK